MRNRLWSLAIVLLVASRVLALDITAPGVTVPRGQTGIVQSDLACVPAGVGILLETGARLQLNGHTLDGCSITAVDEKSRITVLGPGTVREAGISIREGVLRVQDVFVDDPPDFGIWGATSAGEGPSTLRLKDVTVSDAGSDGVRATRVKAENLNVAGSGADGSGIGVVGFGGVYGRNINVVDSASEGVFAAAGSITLKASQVNDNAAGGVLGFGVSRSAVVLIQSIVTGNDANGLADVVSQAPPRVRLTTCGSSLDSQRMVPWGVCAND